MTKLDLYDYDDVCQWCGNRKVAFIPLKEYDCKGRYIGDSEMCIECFKSDKSFYDVHPTKWYRLKVGDEE